MQTLIVVGAGNAGLPAAIEAADRGAKVVLVEKNDFLGGMLHWSSATMSGAGARLQKAKGILDDSPEQHFQDCMHLGRNRQNPAVLRVLTQNAAETIDWLEEIGVPFTPDSPRLSSEHEAYGKARSFYPHQATSPRTGGFAGGGIVFDRINREFEKRLETGRIDLRTRTRMTGLIVEDGRVTGVRTESREGEETIRGDAVILTTGGYLANNALVRQLHPQFERPITLCGPHATGDAIPLVQALGGQFINQDILLLLQGYCEDPENPGFTIAGGSLRAGRPAQDSGDIWVNRNGQRFIREDEVSPDAREQALLAQPGAVCWAIFDDLMREGFTKKVNEYTRSLAYSGLLVGASTLEELATKIGLPPDNLRKAVDDYNAGQEIGSDAFGRSADAMPVPITTGPFYAVRSDGTAILSFAGLLVDDRLQVVHENGDPIPGLYAAGEIIGAGQTNGEAFCSGMAAGPAITGGRLAVRNALGVAIPA